MCECANFSFFILHSSFLWASPSLRSGRAIRSITFALARWASRYGGSATIPLANRTSGASGFARKYKVGDAKHCVSTYFISNILKMNNL
jgi:hypothetical protein